MYLDFSNTEIVLIALIFMWTAFVRSGLGFGGIALGLPLMLLLRDEALLWLPIFGIHVLVFSSLALSSRLKDVDWKYLKHSVPYIAPATLVGIFGVISLPNHILVMCVYGFTLIYAIMWLINWTLSSHHALTEKLLLVFGGYIVGMALPGMTLMSSVFMRHVSKEQVRNTLYVLMISITTVRLGSFLAADINMHYLFALALIPFAYIGHYLGMKAHDFIMQNSELFKRIVGGMLIVISLIGLIKLAL